MTGQRSAGYWPRSGFLFLGIVPVLFFVFLAGTLLRESMPAVRQLGLGHLFSTQYSGRYGAGLDLYGLLPPLWGTVLVTVVATALAFPVSLAMALLANEFPLGVVSRSLSVVLGILGGIPPVVYALMGAVLVRTFIVPKLCAPDLPTEVAASLPGLPPWNAGLLPNSMPNSLLLAAMLLALWIIPFMAPLVLDAIRSVPLSLREGSLALGANRWHTVRHVVLPVALPGILAVLALGMLKCAGDVVIVSFVVGYEGSLPTPLWDVLERVPVLTATGAGLQGGLGGGAEGRSLIDSSVASFAALLLLVIAAGMMTLTAQLERTMRRRLLA